ncbi:hypothetical protein TWF281_004492 [Arthrobotrys megalospora]
MVSKSCYHRNRPTRMSYRVFWKPAIKALPPNHFLSEAVRPVLLKIVRKIKDLGLKIVCIDPVIMDGYPTLLITSRQTKPANFDYVIAPAIRSMIQTKQYCYWIEFSTERSDTVPVPLPSFQNYLPGHFPGQSIGVAGVPWSAGTVGGYIRFDDPELQDYCFGMSCHHVLQPTRPAGLTEEAQLQKRSRHLNTVGLPHDTVKWNLKGGDRIVTPALFDHVEQISHLLVKLAELRRIMAGIRRKYAKQRKRAPEDFQMRKAEREDREQIRQMQKRDCTLGKVAMTSGYRMDPVTGVSIDWGLIRLQKDAAAENIFVFPAEGWSGQLEQYVLDIGDPVSGDEVFKIGRSTKFTTGVVSSALHAIDLDSNGIFTNEWAVIGDRKHSFSCEGDSGSWVINKRFELVGMLVGSNGVVSYMTPIKTVIGDIETATGKKVILQGDIGKSWQRNREGGQWGFGGFRKCGRRPFEGN